EADLLLLPTRKESFGMVTIEAMSMGCVPIAYDVPSGSTEIIESGKSGLLVPLGDICAWAEHVRTLHQDRQRLAQLSVAAIARARNHFNGDVMGQNMANFLTEVMTHATTHAAQRECGMPPETPAIHAPSPHGYQRLPASLRKWIRNCVCASPK